MNRSHGLLLVLLATCHLFCGCGQDSPATPPADRPDASSGFASEYINWRVFGYDLEVTDAFLTYHSLPGEVDEVAVVGRQGRGLFFDALTSATPLFLETEADLLAVDLVSFDHIVAGGELEDGSAALRAFHGDGWETISHTASGNITGIHDNLICTDEGELLLYSRVGGTSFVFQAPAGVRFRAIHNRYGAAPGDFAVGDGGVVYRRLEDGTFEDESIPGGPDLVAVCSARDEVGGPVIIYAVGGDEIWRYQEGVWSLDYDNAAGDLNDIEYFLIDQLYAVGDGGLFLRKDEHGWWDDYVEGEADLVAISTSIYSSEDKCTIAFCGSRGQVYQRLGEGWTRTYANAEGAWPALHTLDDGRVFAANLNRLMQYTGSDWTEFAVWDMGHEIYDLHLNAPDDIWALGWDGGIDHFVLRYDGIDWSILKHASLFGFTALWSDATAENVFVADGMGGIWRRFEELWELEYTHPENALVYGLDGDSADNLVAVGEGGMILRRGAGGWTAQASGSSADLFAIDGSWAVGDGGTVLRYEGGGWSSVGPSWAGRFNGVHADDLGHVMVVGDDATAFVFDGSEWTRLITHLPGVDFLSVESAGPDRVWVGGNEGFLLSSPEG